MGYEVIPAICGSGPLLNVASSGTYPPNYISNKRQSTTRFTNSLHHAFLKKKNVC